MEDITPELLKKIQDDFQDKFNKSELISNLYEKVRDGTATYKEANQFAVEVGDFLANAYGEISSDILPDGKMYYNIAQRIISPTMENNYNLITDVTSQVQQSLNEAAGIGIRAVVPELNRDRIEGIINRIVMAEAFDDIAWILGEPIRNFSQSIVDDSIRANAEFHARSGMKPVIVRKLAGGCCEWCAKLAGTYQYPDDVPHDVYRRHQRCRCTVDYNPRDGKIQNTHTKKWRDETAIEKRKVAETIINEELRAAKFKRTFNAVSQQQVVNTMRKDSQQWINSLTDEEKRCIQKYTLNDGDSKPKFYERLNAMLRGQQPEDETLRYYADTISNSLKRSSLNENIIAYRGMANNPFAGYKSGEYLTLNQFTSTSVKSSGAFDKPVRMVIYAKRGTKGVAYIESISKFPKQRELLFDKDAIYKVLSNSKHLIELEVI